MSFSLYLLAFLKCHLLSELQLNNHWAVNVSVAQKFGNPRRTGGFRKRKESGVFGYLDWCCH